jgi:plastocyanin
MRRSLKQWAWICVMAAVFSLAGCNASLPASSTDNPPTPGKPFDPATLGTVTGTVTFAGKAPTPIKLDTSMDPGCSLSGKDAHSEQYAVSNGKLANVYIYVKSMKLNSGMGMISASVSGSPAATIDQNGCVYTPHVVAVQVGDSIEIDNHDPTMHNIHTMPTVPGNQPVDTSQGPKGRPQLIHFNHPEQMIPLRCNVHPWMEAFINVSSTPWFAVTGPDGKFTLKGMPPGEYTIGAVQEILGEQALTVTVKPQNESKADFTFAIK